MSRKGGQFERDTCRQISLWWSKGKRDDLSWRSHGSGARATARAKRGKTTKGQYGDICATDSSIIPLFETLVIELKTGYKDQTITNIVDYPEKMSHLTSTQKWEEWILKTHVAHERAGTVSWIIIHQRPNRLAMVYMPLEFYQALHKVGVPFGEFEFPYITVVATVRGSGGELDFHIRGIPWDQWLTLVKPKHIIEINRRY